MATAQSMVFIFSVVFFVFQFNSHLQSVLIPPHLQFYEQHQSFLIWKPSYLYLLIAEERQISPDCRRQTKRGWS